MAIKFYFVNVISHDGFSVDRFPIRSGKLAFSLSNKFKELGLPSYVTDCIGTMPRGVLTTHFA